MKHLANLLVSEGFTSIEEIAQSTPEDISKIDAIDEETAKELINRSKENLTKEKEAVAMKLKELRSRGESYKPQRYDPRYASNSRSEKY